MQVISLFSGIGGFEYAAELMGWKNIVSCEINPFGRKVLKYYWPESYHHKDIHTLTYETITKKAKYNPEEPTIIVGGFPCQPFSIAGQRKGTEDDRNLWPEMYRVIKEVKPDWVVGENVHGIINWSDGLVFEQVHIDLESAGYEVQAFVLPACSVNAPHKRNRVWFIANCNNSGSIKRLRTDENREKKNKRRKRQSQPKYRTDGSNGIAPNTNNQGLQRGEKKGIIRRSRKKSHQQPTGFICTDWQDFPTQSPVCGRNDGIPAGLSGITFPKWRTEAIKAMGNAIVPQVVFQIFQTINEYELLHAGSI